MSEEAVSDLYLKMKSRMHPTHTTSQRRLTLFRFVTERSSGVNKLDRGGACNGLTHSSVAQPTTQWNEEYPSSQKWHYSDVRNLRRDFVEASKLLLGY